MHRAPPCLRPLVPLLGWACVLVPLLPCPSRASTLQAYASPITIVQGGSVSVHVSSSHDPIDIIVERIGAADFEVYREEGLPGFVQAVPESAWTGCGWSPSATFPVDSSWPSGVYRVTCRPGYPSSDVAYALFTVVEDDPGSTARILFQNSVTTWQAYNVWGGRSFYESQSPSGERATTISFERPHALGYGLGTFPYWELPMIRWLEGEGFAVEYATDLDSHADPELESHYDVFLIAGHDEYWSKEMFDGIEGRIAAGRDVAIFGGNTCWWQVRFSPGLDAVTCYKVAAWDPLYGIDDDRVTVHWHDPPVLRPANTWSGASLLHGGDPDVGNNAYRVYRPEHWVFDGTGIQSGDEFGGDEEVVGNEVDGAALTWTGGLPVPTGADGTPLHFEILATSPASQGWATLGILEGPTATVFNAASITWSWGLEENPIVQRITRNVLEALADGDPYLPRTESLAISQLSVSGGQDNVRIRVQVTNPSTQESSRRASMTVEAASLGGDPATARFLLETDVEPLAPGATVVRSVTVPPDSLPPDSELRIAGQGIPVSGCPVGKPWRGELAVRWAEAGLGPEVHVEGWVDLPVCPGAGVSAARIMVSSPSAWTWTMDGALPGWSAWIAEDSGGEPGDPIPPAMPAGAFAGWIVVEADAGVPFGESAGIVWWRDSGEGAVATVVAATACDCLATSVIASAPSPRFGLDPPRPNPAWGGVALGWTVASEAPCRVVVSNVAGRTVRILWDGSGPVGHHGTTWDGRLRDGKRAPAGVYFVRLEQGDDRATRKVVLTR